MDLLTTRILRPYQNYNLVNVLSGPGSGAADNEGDWGGGNPADVMAIGKVATTAEPGWAIADLVWTWGSLLQLCVCVMLTLYPHSL